MIHVLIARFSEEIPEPDYQKLLQQIPPILHIQNLKFVRWQERQANLLGKLLLGQALERVGLDRTYLNKIKYDSYGRPAIADDIDFNISHSGKYVLCAIGKNVRLGIDIEEVKPIDFKDFQDVMSNEQWQLIGRSVDPLRTFYKLWTMKESIIKADGRGLSFPLKEISVKNNRYHHWCLRELSMDDGYCSYLSTNIENASVTIEPRTPV